MLDERVAELIQADIDGELPPADRAELEDALAGSEEARRFRREMMRVARVMIELPPVEPPAGLRQRILDQVDLPARSRWREWAVALFRPASYGMAVAAGVVIGIGVVNITPKLDLEHSGDMTNLVGSMMSPEAQPPATTTDRLEIDGPGVEGWALLRKVNNVWAIEFDLDSQRAVEVRVDLAASAMRLGGLADSPAGLKVIDYSGGHLRVVNQGRHRFVLFLRPEPGKGLLARGIPVAVVDGTRTVFAGRLQPSG